MQIPDLESWRQVKARHICRRITYSEQSHKWCIYNTRDGGNIVNNPKWQFFIATRVVPRINSSLFLEGGVFLISSSNINILECEEIGYIRGFRNTGIDSSNYGPRRSEETP